MSVVEVYSFIYPPLFTCVYPINYIGDEMRVEITSYGSDSGSSSSSAQHLVVGIKYRFDDPRKSGKIQLCGFEALNLVDDRFVDWENDDDYDSNNSTLFSYSTTSADELDEAEHITLWGGAQCLRLVPYQP